MTLSFEVRRCKPELISPAKRTPHELKRLSDLDSSEGLHYHMPIIQFYKHHDDLIRDPVQVIREGIALALVYYYPFAGRLREVVDERMLVVDCTGEGVMFIEADADVTLDHFGDSLYPPFPCLNQLLCDVPGSSEILHSPLLLIQVTRLKCMGFIFTLRFNHTMADGVGIILFMKAVGEMARGAAAPLTLPVWDRHLLNSRVLPKNHFKYKKVKAITVTSSSIEDKAHRSFFFGSAEISAIRKHIPPHMRSCSTFEVLTACLWRCHTRAINPDPDEKVCISFTINTHSKFNPPLPRGYYGNAFAVTDAITTAGKLCNNPLGYALDLIHKCKNEVTEEYMLSQVDLYVVNDMSLNVKMVQRRYVVSDVTRTRFRDVDFGWGEAVYGGPAVGAMDGVSFYIPFRNHQGEEGIMLPMCLSPVAMETFVDALNDILNEIPKHFIQSPL